MIRPSAPVILFTGKGGVGKTSMACATAIACADAGERVLLVSTDPASNLDEVLGVDLSSGDAREVPSLAGLSARNIDPAEAARRYRERVVAPVRDLLPAAAVASIEEQLSGGCTLEIAAFDEFARLLADPVASGFDRIVFDTAPTGHTLRLMELPAAWTGFFETNTTGTSCLGPLSGLEAERATYAAALDTLRRPGAAETVLVTRPDEPSLREAARATGELRALGIEPTCLIVNGVPPEPDPSDPIASAMASAARRALEAMPASLASLEVRHVPLRARSPVGLDGLRGLLRPADEAGAGGEGSAPEGSGFPSLEGLVGELEGTGRGVILTMGKGGVGKTRVAVALAEGLADRGHQVLLTTTDPATHLGAPAGVERPGLRVERIDADEVTRSYAAEVMATAGAGLDASGRALLEEDLRSPCTEEVAVFRAFAQAVARGEQEFVVIDTAPTGHTLLLMDAAEAYHREVLRKPGDAPDAVRRLLPRLRDPGFARVVVVTLAEPTPVHEAARLQDDLIRAGITPFAWVVNQCLTGLELTDPFLELRRGLERPYLDEVRGLARRVVLSPWAPEVAPITAHASA